MNWHHYIPFATLFAKQVEEVTARPLVTKLVEQSIVGIVAGVIVLYANDRVNSDKIDNLTSQLGDVKQIVLQMQRDLYVPRQDSIIKPSRR